MKLFYSLISGILLLLCRVDCAAYFLGGLFSRRQEAQQAPDSIDFEETAMIIPEVREYMSESEDDYEAEELRADIQAQKIKNELIVKERRAQYLAGLPRDSDPMTLIQERMAPNWKEAILQPFIPNDLKPFFSLYYGHSQYSSSDESGSSDAIDSDSNTESDKEDAIIQQKVPFVKGPADLDASELDDQEEFEVIEGAQSSPELSGAKALATGNITPSSSVPVIASDITE